MINVVVEMGRLTADPELRKTKGAESKSVCLFSRSKLGDEYKALANELIQGCV